MKRGIARGRNIGFLIAAAPLAMWLLMFLVVPVLLVVWYSFLRRGLYGEVIHEFTLGNYARVFDSLYLSVFARSALFSLLTTAICLVLGFFVALAMVTASPRVRQWLFLGLMIPFLTNFIVRVYAVRILLSVEGPLNGALLGTGLLSSPLLLNDSLFAVAIGMVLNYLPFMVLPIYVVLDKMDFSLVEAAADLGARWSVIIRRVLLPAAMPGLVSGSALVLVPVLGEFMVPDLLGGAKNMLIGNLITEQFLKARDWPFGAALASTLLACMFAMVLLQQRRGIR